jgi:hypothetical protein
MLALPTRGSTMPRVGGATAQGEREVEGMTRSAVDAWLRVRRDELLGAMIIRMRDDGEVGRLATQRGLSEEALSRQVASFWLEAIRSDLALGSTTVMEQNLAWLASMRAGHRLAFDDDMVRRWFDLLSQEIEKRLEPQPLRREYAAYRTRVDRLIAEAFPVSGACR